MVKTEEEGEEIEEEKEEEEEDDPAVWWKMEEVKYSRTRGDSDGKFLSRPPLLSPPTFFHIFPGLSQSIISAFTRASQPQFPRVFFTFRVITAIVAFNALPDLDASVLLNIDA